MKLGGWKINPVINAMPQKVATAFSEAANTLVGASYEPICYLGSQVANGTNHAVVAKQTLVIPGAKANIVIMKFNEKGMDCHLYAIEPIIEDGGQFGGYVVDPKVGDDIDENALKSFNDVTAGWCGVAIHPVALLASKVVKGINLTFLCSVTGIYPGAEAEAKLVTVNGLTKTIDFEDIL